MPSLEFKGKAIIETHHHLVPHHRLEFDAKLSELPKGQKPSLDGNLIIEGDNLLALKALLPTHAGKIKCIYIDPPYNTGEEGWFFNDNLTQPQFKDWIGQTVGKEGEDSTRHDKWCCMIYPRLSLLRQLLTEDGIAFISIGEDELHHARLIANEVFKTPMPLITFVWRRRTTSGLRKNPVSIDHEYVLGYAANPQRVQLAGLTMGESAYPLVESDGTKYASTDLTIGATAEDRPNQFYVITNPRSKVEYPASPNRVWRFEKEVMEKEVIGNGLVIWPDEVGGDMKRPRYKTRYNPNDPKTRAVSSWIRGSNEKVSDDDVDSEEYDEDVAEISSGLTAEGGRVLRRIFGKKVFNYPKPPSLLRSLLRIATAGNDLVLDSCAGSGTTGHAALELNKDDGGSRRFVLIQQPYDSKENEKEKFNICQAVTAERVRRVIGGYSYKKNGGKTEKVAPLGGSFSYIRVGEPLFGEYRDFGKRPPDFETLARYIFYTETSREVDFKKIDMKSGYIGEVPEGGGTSYYLFYTPGSDNGNEFSVAELKRMLKTDKNRTWVVYCEKYWVHEDDLSEFEKENNVRVRPMVIPFQLQ